MRQYPVEALGSLSRITFVIPFRQSFDRPDAMGRLRYLLSYLRQTSPDIKIVISDQTLAAPVAHVVGVAYGARCVWQPKFVYSPASCKNFGAAAVDTEYMLFVDIDVLPTQHLYSELSLLMEYSDIPALWFPVHFLQREAPPYRCLARSKNLHLRDWTNLIDQIGFATGIQFFSRNFFSRMGGYDESFRGYGCEDIEMIHRCALALEWLSPHEIDENYLCDHRTKDRKDYRGFRKKMAEIVESKISSDLVYCVHSWHPRRNKRIYRRLRDRNDKILLKRLNQSTSSFFLQPP